MESLSAKTYLAQVFDKRVNESLRTINNICEALDVGTNWIDGSSSSPPIEEAKELIASSDFLVAFCTRKDKLDGCDEYHTSNALREEVAIAKAQGKPVICFMEAGVRPDGFAGSTSTYSFLENAENLTPGDIKNLVKGIHRTKLKAIKETPEIVHATGVNNYSITSLVMEIELVNDRASGLFWHYIIERTFEFESDHDQPLTHSAFCLEGIEKAEKPIYVHEFARNGVSASPSLDVRDLPNGIDIKSTFIPAPTKGDKIFVREQYRSPYLNPVYVEQGVGAKVPVGNCVLDAYDGLCVISRIRELTIRYKFPKGYNITNLQPLVMTFSNALDHANKDEIDRLTTEKCVTIREFNNTVTAEMFVARPLYQYFYGMGWNIPSEKLGVGVLSAAAPAFD